LPSTTQKLLNLILNPVPSINSQRTEYFDSFRAASAEANEAGLSVPKLALLLVEHYPQGSHRENSGLLPLPKDVDSQRYKRFKAINDLVVL
jgi:hypothetical protein